MKIFKEIHDEDIFENYIKSDNEYTLRPTVKGIILDDQNNIALLKARGHYLLPGGGVEADESSLEAIKREIMEEVGCNIDDIKEIGASHQFRNKYMRHYEVIFFTAKVIGEKNKPTTTQEDEIKDVELFWFDKEEVFTILKSQIETKDENEYEFCFNARSHFQAFEEYFISQPSLLVLHH